MSIRVCNGQLYCQNLGIPCYIYHISAAVLFRVPGLAVPWSCILHTTQPGETRGRLTIEILFFLTSKHFSWTDLYLGNEVLLSRRGGLCH